MPNYSGDINPPFINVAPSPKYVMNQAGFILPGTLMRPDYDEANNNLGVRLEEQRTNLCLWSSDLNQARAPWSASCGVGAQIAGPDGTTLDGRMLSTNGNNAEQIQQNFTVTPGTVMTASVYYMKGTLPDSVPGIFIYDNTAPTTIFQGAISNPLVDGKWVRQQVTFTVPAGCTSLRFSPMRTRSSHTGGTVGIAWAQLEAAASASSYMPTTTAAVTRSADNIIKPLIEMPWNSNGSNILIIKGRLGPWIGSPQVIVQIDNNTNTERVVVERRNETQFRFANVVGNATTRFIDITAASNGLDFALAFEHGPTEIAVCVNAATVQKSLGAASYPTGLSTLRLGKATASAWANGWIKSILLLPRTRANDAELQTLTTL